MPNALRYGWRVILAHVPAQPFIVSASIADFAPVQRAFAWTQAEDLPLILGQVNFFMVYGPVRK